MIKPHVQMHLDYVASKDCIEVTVYWGMLGYYRQRADIELYPEYDPINPVESMVQFIRDNFSDLIIVTDKDDTLFSWGGHRFIPKVFRAEDYEPEKFTAAFNYDAPGFLFQATDNDRVYVRALEDFNYWIGKMEDRAYRDIIKPPQPELTWLSDPRTEHKDI